MEERGLTRIFINGENKGIHDCDSIAKATTLLLSFYQGDRTKVILSPVETRNNFKTRTFFTDDYSAHGQFYWYEAYGTFYDD